MLYQLPSVGHWVNIYQIQYVRVTHVPDGDAIQKSTPYHVRVWVRENFEGVDNVFIIAAFSDEDRADTYRDTIAAEINQLFVRNKGRS